MCLAHFQRQGWRTRKQPMQVGSITKTFIAVGVLRLVTEGRVALDTPVRHYLPDLPIDNPWEHEQPVLVRHRCALPAAV